MTKSSEKLPKFSIVMANFNGYSSTSRAINALRNLSYNNYEIIVVDDCSTDNSLDRLKKDYPAVIYIQAPKNGGLNKSYNLGIHHALTQGAEYVYTCQNDTYNYSENILEEILDVFQSDEKIGMVGTTIYDSHGEYRWDGKFKNKLGLAMNVSECFAISKIAYSKIGLFNEKLNVYFEDNDLIQRLHLHGFTTGFTTKASLVHTGQVTFKKVKWKWNFIRSRNITFYLKHYQKTNKVKVILFNIIGNFRFMVVPKMKDAAKNSDYKGMCILFFSFFSGVLVGLFIRWKEELPWSLTNNYPHYH